MVESKPTFVDCNSEAGIDVPLVQMVVEPTEFDLATIQIHYRFNEDGQIVPPIRNTFPKDDIDREYICYLCSRR